MNQAIATPTTSQPFDPMQQAEHTIRLQSREIDRLCMQNAKLRAEINQLKSTIQQSQWAHL